MIDFIQPVILCGGSGTRLWPLSRAGFPKQFLCLTGNETLFQLGAKRLSNLGGSRRIASPHIVCNEEHRFLVSEQLREVEIEPSAVILEPAGRNTAPALTLAAMAACEAGDDPILVVIPADQMVSDVAAFGKSIQIAIDHAAKGNVAILGIKPNHPETGYGYVKVHSAHDLMRDAFVVERFVEKPDAATASHYLLEGGYFWNAGIFVLKASVWIKALERFRPNLAKASQLAWDARTIDSVFIRPGKAEFEEIQGESVDYAVMENCPGSDFEVTMVPLDAGWSDLGAWDAVWNVASKDSLGNAHIGDVLATDSRNTLVHATSRLVSLVGVEDLVVIETPDAVLVAKKSRSQDVKNIVNVLNIQKRQEYALHRKVHRPWGWYDSIDEGQRFKVKRMQVNPKSSLSLQKHHHRAEHWVVVMGTAEITCGDKKVLLTENQSTYIPLGEIHRLTNPGAIPLEIIEVQSGSYLGEDDIVRYEDKYGRKS